jgi:hypothetical protein
MRIRALAAVVVMEDGSRWAVAVQARDGGAQVRAEPGYTDPAPVELGKGIQWIPASTLDGTWALMLAGVGSVEMRRLTDG